VKNKKDKYIKKLIRNAFLRFRTIEIKSFFIFVLSILFIVLPTDHIVLPRK